MNVPEFLLCRNSCSGVCRVFPCESPSWTSALLTCFPFVAWDGLATRLVPVSAFLFKELFVLFPSRNPVFGTPHACTTFTGDGHLGRTDCIVSLDRHDGVEALLTISWASSLVFSIWRSLMSDALHKERGSQETLGCLLNS